MTDSLSDDARLRATEAQMRRALGLHNTSPTQAATVPPRPRRAHHRRNVGVSSAMARCLSRSSTGIRTAVPAPTSSTRRGRLCGSRSRPESSAEHLLQEAQATIRDLQTKLAHERLATDEAIQRVDRREAGCRTGAPEGAGGIGDRAGLPAEGRAGAR